MVINKWKKELKLIHPVHAPWVELAKEQEDIKWEPSWANKYIDHMGDRTLAQHSL